MDLFAKLKEPKVLIGGLILIVIIVIGSIYINKENEAEIMLKPKGEESINEESQSQDVPIEMIQVDVKGEVMHPGVYTLESGSRVHDAVKKAGGLTKDADTVKVNLAAFLNDGQVVYIPAFGEENSVWTTESAETAASDGKININTATANELEQLPGIGPAKAKAIIAYREEHGPFTEVEQLGEVSGIGEKTLEKLLPFVSIK